MELSGYFFRNLLKKTRRRFSLSAGEQALYQELVDICNEENWSQSFQVSNGELTTALNCNENTLRVWRQSLINAGLIVYNSGKSKRAFGNYGLVSQTTSKINTNTIPNTAPKAVPNTAPNPVDYIQLNKTKLNNVLLEKEPKGDFIFSSDFEEKEIERGPVITEAAEKEKSCAKKEKEFAERFIAAFNEVSRGIPQVRDLTKARLAKITARLNEVGEDGMNDLLKQVSESNFLNGENDRNWVANFDWILEPKNFVKIREGNYKNKTNNGKPISNTNTSTPSTGSGNGKVSFRQLLARERAKIDSGHQNVGDTRTTIEI